MLGALHQLGETRQLVAHLLEIRVRHLEQQGAIALDDQGIVGSEGDHGVSRLKPFSLEAWAGGVNEGVGKGPDSPGSRGLH